MKPLFRATLGCVFLATAGLPSLAEDGAANPATFKLLNRSSFSPGDVRRNPFQPIGWKRTMAGPAVAAVSVQTIEPKDFLVTSILLGAQPKMAMINGKPYTEGELIQIGSGAQVTKVLVVSIQDGVVVVRSSNKQLAVPLKRQ